jgi:hypothetical protein
MRFLIDNALSPVVAEGLRRSGNDATHVGDHGLAAAEDSLIFDDAFREVRFEAGRLVVEIFGRSDGEPLILPVDELREVLRLAGEMLRGTDDSRC